MKKLVLLLLLLSVGAHGQNVVHITVSGRDVAMWRPVTAVPASGYPVILFSHGLGGCSTQSVFLMEALARAGYLVLAPNHQDAPCGRAREQGSGWSPGARRPQEPFRDRQVWSDATYKDRAADMKAVLDAVLRAKSFQGMAVDSQRIGLAGHSLGGYTVLGLAGAWPAWKDSRVRAVLAMSPYCSPYIDHGDLGHMNVPIMYQGGTRDWGISPSIRRPHGAYDLSSAPKYYVEFAGAGHFAWTDLNKTYQELIDSYGVAFFDRYLKGETNPDPLGPLTRNPLPQGVSDLRVDLK